jgi:hypothetical protein
VKAENPGVDLLIPMPWDNLIKVTEPVEVALPLVGLGGGLPMADENAEPTSAIAEPTSAIAEPAAAETPAIERSSSTALASIDQDSSGMGLWLPIIFLIAIGSAVGLAGALVFRR